MWTVFNSETGTNMEEIKNRNILKVAAYHNFKSWLTCPKKVERNPQRKNCVIWILEPTALYWWQTNFLKGDRKSGEQWPLSFLGLVRFPGHGLFLLLLPNGVTAVKFLKKWGGETRPIVPQCESRPLCVLGWARGTQGTIELLFVWEKQRHPIAIIYGRKDLMFLEEFGCRGMSHRLQISQCIRESVTWCPGLGCLGLRTWKHL